MKKWHMEGIVSTDISHGHKLIVPDESHMYGRIRTYSARPEGGSVHLDAPEHGGVGPPVLLKDLLSRRAVPALAPA